MFNDRSKRRKDEKESEKEKAFIQFYHEIIAEKILNIEATEFKSSHYSCAVIKGLKLQLKCFLNFQKKI